jgi:ArsR family transcriptional regulator, lead/cadmium/zinc/bismuth-responsive transcriptional repressor
LQTDLESYRDAEKGVKECDILYLNICSGIHMSLFREHPVSTPLLSPSDSSGAASVAAGGVPGGAETCNAPHLSESEARRRLLMSPHAVEALAETFRVLGDPTRVRILDALSAGELCVCDIASFAGISESAVSHQLRLLRSMRLVRARRAGRLVFYALDDHHIIELLKQALTHVEE